MMLKAKSSMAFAVVAGAILMGSRIAGATQFMNINFDGDKIGSAPTTGPAGTPITTVQAIGGYDSSGYNSPPTPNCGTILVDDVAGMSKAAVMTTNPANGILGALWMDTGFTLTSSRVTLQFDLSILAAPTSATVQSKLLDDTDQQAGILFGINTFTSAGRAFCFAAAPTSDTGGVFAIRNPDNTRLITFGEYVEGQKYNVTLSADYSTGTVDAYLNGVLAMGGYHFWTSGASSPLTTSEFFMHLNGQADYSNIVGIDNIRAYDSAVPEPFTLGFGAAGLLAALKLRRRARK